MHVIIWIRCGDSLVKYIKNDQTASHLIFAVVQVLNIVESSAFFKSELVMTLN